ncbi:hypothetical protein [Cellulosimicrobium composti]|uniref:hypothetical protein n=1 Tax=Cellulosimicrobium composti TaxID=2672572 RepID=UPI00378E3DBA
MTPVNVVTRAPHDQVLDRLRAAHLEQGRVGPTDDRGWTFAEVDTELVEPGSGSTVLGDRSPESVADVLARVDALVAAPYVAQLDAASDELPDGVSALVAVRGDDGGRAVVVTWAPVDAEPGSGDPAYGAARLDAAPDEVLAAVDSLVGLRVQAGEAADRLRHLDHPDVLLDALVAVAHLPATDATSPDAVAHLVRADAAFVRAAVRRAESAWVRETDGRTVVWAADRPPSPVLGVEDPDADDEFAAAFGAELRARRQVEQGLRPGEGALTVERTGATVSWTVSTPGRTWAHGGWDEEWSELQVDGSDAAYDALVEVFGESRDPARLRALLAERRWEGDPVAELAYLLGLPSALVEAVSDPERFRHGAERVRPLGPDAPLSATERAALAARAPRRPAAATVRDVVLLALGLALFALGAAIFATDGGLVGSDRPPAWSFPVWAAGGLLALVTWGALGSARAERRRFLADA